MVEEEVGEEAGQEVGGDLYISSERDNSKVVPATAPIIGIHNNSETYCGFTGDDVTQPSPWPSNQDAIPGTLNHAVDVYPYTEKMSTSNPATNYLASDPVTPDLATVTVPDYLVADVTPPSLATVTASPLVTDSASTRMTTLLPSGPAVKSFHYPSSLNSLPPIAQFSTSLPTSLPTGITWSPCGLHLAVSTDTSIQVYSPGQSSGEHTELTPSAIVKHAECLYSWQWKAGPSRSSFLVTTGRYQPVQLYNCQTNNSHLAIDLASTYKCINQLDELSHAFSVSLDKSCSKLFCGLKGEVRVFDVSRPGRCSTSHVTRGDAVQGGIISCLAVSEVVPVYAAGCYDRTVGLYSADQGDRLCVLRGHTGGVTQVMFSNDGTKLLSGGRKDNDIVCWDIRQPGMVLYTLQREVTTNQTIQFSLSYCQKYLISANTDGSVRLWDLDKQADSVTGVLEPLTGWLLHRDAVNGVSWHPEGDKLASCSGQRHFKLDKEMVVEGEMEEEENIVVVWSLR